LRNDRRTSTSKASIATAAGFALRPASAHLGADLIDFNLSALLERPSATAVTELKAALNQYLVLRVRGAVSGQDQLVRFARLFGEVLSDRKNAQEKDSAQLGNAELKVLSNALAPDGRPLGDKGSDPQIWHTDGSFREVPMAYSLLYCVSAPDNPSVTSFMSAYQLYESLPSELKAEIAELNAIHSVHNRSQDFWDFMEGPSVSPEKRAEGAPHPLVRLHAETHRPLLYLPRRRDAQIRGRSPFDSRLLMERLWAEVFRSRSFWGVALEAGDFVFFDNRAALHNREGWSATQERIVLHLAVAGERPISAFGAATYELEGGLT
jgi:taurine dioxygenase